MEFEVSLKIHQENILNSFTEKFEYESKEETILALIQNSLASNKREDIYLGKITCSALQGASMPNLI